MDKPSLSVVIPAYNAQRFLRSAIDSVLAQTVPVAQIIVVDDGSTDGTPAIAESYGPAVHLLRQRNAGPSVARNLGSSIATADFIAFLDADDTWRPDKIAKQLAAFDQNPAAVLCYTGLLNFNEEERTEFVSPPLPLTRLRSELRIRNPRIVPSCVVVRSAAFRRSSGFDPALKGSEDWDFALAMSGIGPFCTVDEPLTLYRVAATGLSGDPDWMFQETHKMLARRLLADKRGPARWLWRRRILSYHAYTAALTARAAGKVAHERRYMLRSLLHSPSPLWKPIRFKAAAVTLRNALRPRPGVWADAPSPAQLAE